LARRAEVEGGRADGRRELWVVPLVRLGVRRGGERAVGK
jgi:hypothetical protein